MKILVVVEDWISFYIQAEALLKGFKQLGVDYKAVTIKEARANEEVFKEERWEAVLGVGSWYGWEYLVKTPTSYGLNVLPWLVSNGGVNKPEVIESLNSLNKWFTPSEFCRQKFSQSGLNDQNIEVIPEAVDDNFWQPQPINQTDDFANLLSITSSLELENKFDILKAKKTGVPILFTMGGDATSKGAQEVLFALGRLEPDLPWIYIIKTLPQKHSFRRGLEEFTIITRQNLDGRVRYIMGEFSQEFIRGLINICDIYVAPSRGEGFGLPFVQAGMCGKPVISIDALSIKEIVVSGETGFLVKPRKVGSEVRANVNDLADKLKKLIEHKELREAMGKRGMEYCRKKFNTRVVAQQFLEKL